MTREHISLFDTTLRDGQQTPGVDFSLDDKLVVIDLLDKLGVDYIEGGYPGANPTDTALFSEDRKTKATFTAFGMVKRAGRSVSNDSGLQDLIRANSKAICFVAKSWDYHVRVALGCTNEENLEFDPPVRGSRRFRRQGSAGRLRTFLRWLQGQSRNMRWPAPGRPMTPARAGWCSATPMAAPCPPKFRKSSVP